MPIYLVFAAGLITVGAVKNVPAGDDAGDLLNYSFGVGKDTARGDMNYIYGGGARSMFSIP